MFKLRTHSHRTTAINISKYGEEIKINSHIEMYVLIQDTTTYSFIKIIQNTTNPSYATHTLYMNQIILQK